MPRLWPALKFALWTWVWTLLSYAAFLGGTALIPKWRMPAAYYAPQAVALYLLGLTLALGAAWLAPLLAKLFTARPLLLTPIFAAPLLWLWQTVWGDAPSPAPFFYFLALLTVGTALASLPGWLASRRDGHE